MVFFIYCYGKFKYFISVVNVGMRYVGFGYSGVVFLNNKVFIVDC